MLENLRLHFETELESCLKNQPGIQKIAIAVSGGSDSMALCLLARNWCETNQVELLALTVDHGLRAEAAGEAVLVRQWCTRIGIEHKTLTGKGTKPLSAIQEYARDLRYSLLLDECRERGIKALLVGHQLEDQLETFLMRASKGSGLTGLCAMQTVSLRNDILILRPLLSIQRQKLREFLRLSDQSWIEDPSNENPAYTRTETGQILKLMVQMQGREMGSMARLTHRLQRAEQALSSETSDRFAQAVEISLLGYVSLDLKILRQWPEEFQVRILERAFRIVRGPAARIKLSDLENLVTDIFSLSPDTDRTMVGCFLSFKEDVLTVCREAGRKGLETVSLKSDSEIIWDDRFRILDKMPELPRPEHLHIGALGSIGWSKLKESHESNLPKLPMTIRNCLPVVWNDGELMAAPLICPQFCGSGIAMGRFEMVFKGLTGL
jgi:tRNA(Ile)-lysidine synthase